MALYDLPATIIGDSREIAVHLETLRGFVVIGCDCGDPRPLLVPIVGLATCAACQAKYIIAELVHRVAPNGNAQTDINVGKVTHLSPGGGFRIRRTL